MFKTTARVIKKFIGLLSRPVNVALKFIDAQALKYAQNSAAIDSPYFGNEFCIR
jgi:hypothetical protein